MEKPTRTEAVKRFLEAKAHPDFAKLYSHDMECQVNVAQDGGTRVEGEFVGRRWHGWTDGVQTWKSFRIPLKANTEPEYFDRPMSFDLAAHVEGIGMTGWDWVNRLSRWVAFDFDAIVGHSDKHSSKLTNDELKDVIKAAESIDWVTVRRSASGRGLHLYVILEPTPTANHNEHAALARAILGMMSALTGFDFEAKVDNCGGNMWVWHRKSVGTAGFEVIKRGTKLSEIPANWRDHVPVISGKRKRNVPQTIEEGNVDAFLELCGQRSKVKLEPEHKRVIEYLKASNAFWWWDPDHHMLVTHTGWLKRAHEELRLRGFFDTLSPQTDLNEQNCYAFPLRRGGWVVRRYTPGIEEHPCWSQDSNGWTRTYFNREPDIDMAARSFGGIEDPSGGYYFREAEVAVQAMSSLGANTKLPTSLIKRNTMLKKHKSGKLQVEIDHDPHDHANEMPGWLVKKGKWVKLFNIRDDGVEESDATIYDDLVRHLVTTTNEDAGWVIKSDDVWRFEPKTNIGDALQAMGLTNKEVKGILGSSVIKPWQIVCKPFQPEYPGDREWNMNAAQLKYSPVDDSENLNYPSWLKILTHCGNGLNEAVEENPWCRSNGIKTGADYLKCWVASLFQHPDRPLPYLFFWGGEDCGKSIFHEALSLLVTKGYQRADHALTSQSGFNGELEGSILCVVEEVDLSRSRTAHNRIKDWVTSRQINIRHMYRTPYHITNTTHWVQCANSHEFCPVFPGDTRITVVHVNSIDPLDLIPKIELISRLEKEAPHFITAILNLELPEAIDRLNIPVINTSEKQIIARANMSELNQFLEDMCMPKNGCKIKFSDFYDVFTKWLDPQDRAMWTKIKTGRELPPHYPKGRGSYNHLFIGNITWKAEPAEPDCLRYEVRGEALEQRHDP